MGPRFLGRGNLGTGSQTIKAATFNGAALFRARKYGKRYHRRTKGAVLQWGRAF